MHCRGKIPASAVETVNTTIRKYGESRVVASMVEMGLQREKLGDAAFCVRVEKSLPKKKTSAFVNDLLSRTNRSLAHTSVHAAAYARAVSRPRCVERERSSP